MTRPRVAILGCRGIPSQYGGFEIAAERIAEGLLRNGIDVTVACRSDQEYQDSSYNGLALDFIEHPSGVFGTLVYDLWSIYRAIKRKDDVILMLGYGASPFFLLPRLFGVQLAVNMDGLEWKRSKWNWIARLYLRLAELIAAHTSCALVSDSTEIAKSLRSRLGARSVYIPYGTELDMVPDPALCEQFGLARRSYYIVVARLEPENSINEIVKGFLDSRTSKKLLIVGSTTPYFELNVKPSIVNSERVCLASPIYDRSMLYSLRSAAKAYLHGHTVGGTNPSLLDSMGAQNLILARDVPFNREVLGDCGYYFKDHRDLSNVLEHIDALPDTQSQFLGAAARQRVTELYNWDDVSDQYLKLIRDLISRKRSSW